MGLLELLNHGSLKDKIETYIRIVPISFYLIYQLCKLMILNLKTVVYKGISKNGEKAVDSILRTYPPI